MQKKKNTAGESLTVNKVVRVKLKGLFGAPELFCRKFRFAMFKYEAVGGRVVLNLVEMDTNRTLNVPLDNVAWLTATPATQADMLKKTAEALKKKKAEGAKLERQTKKLATRNDVAAEAAAAPAGSE